MHLFLSNDIFERRILLHNAKFYVMITDTFSGHKLFIRNDLQGMGIGG